VQTRALRLLSLDYAPLALIGLEKQLQAQLQGSGPA
jgi:hypothetical protein